MERQTRQRIAIWQALERADRPLAPEEVLERARARVPRLGLATVYRNLRALVALGRLRPVTLPGSADRYELAGKDHHHHFHCRECDRVFEVETCTGGFQSITPNGFHLERHEVTLYGLCPNCLI